MIKFQAFVLFPTGDKDDPAGIPSTSAESDVGMTDIFPPPSIVRFTPGTELVTEYRSRFFAELPPERGNITAGASGTGFEATKVAAAARIANEERLVVQESALQKRLQEERARLATEVGISVLFPEAGLYIVLSVSILLNIAAKGSRQKCWAQSTRSIMRLES